MPTHDIIDNRNEKLIDHINAILKSSERAKFAVGYFFLSGFEAVKRHLKDLKEIKLLIGNTTNRATLEQLSEGFKRLELVKEAEKHMRFVKRGKEKQIQEETAHNIRESIELMDQTDEAEELISTLVRLIEEKRLKVKVYTKGRLHAKAYIFDYKNVPDQKGVAIIGSSNLTLAGLEHSTELNVKVYGNNNHEALTKWFDDLWSESKDFDEMLMVEMKQSWAMHPVSPYDIYMKTLYNLVKDRLEGDGKEVIWEREMPALADFQKVAVRQAIQIIKDNGACFVADVVGLGKTYIGTALLKHFSLVYGNRPLIICPPALIDMWERFNERYHLNARILSMGMLKVDENDKSKNILLDDFKYKDRDIVLIDESHNFRYPDTQRYQILQPYLQTRRAIFLTATPRNKSAWDIYYQIKLFHPEDKTELPIDPPDLKQYFKDIENGKKELPDLLRHLLIRRTRTHLIKWGYAKKDEKGRYYIIIKDHGMEIPKYFPKREKPVTLEYSIEKTYKGLYNQIRNIIGKPRKFGVVDFSKLPEEELTYARYGLWNYVKEDKKRKAPYTDLHRAGRNLRGLLRVMLFKRFESSVYAFRESIRRMIILHERFLASLNEGIIPAGEEAEYLLYESDQYDESQLINELRKISRKYDPQDFEIDKLKRDLEKDITLYKKLYELVKDINADNRSPEQDDKLFVLIQRLKNDDKLKNKVLIFTQYAETAKYLYENINPDRKPEIEVIDSTDKNRSSIVYRFSPKANDYTLKNNEKEIKILISTDVLAEGLNLQDCNVIINYDLHWNPVRLIQRIGRIDRIGSEKEKIYSYNFLPETELDRNLGLHEKLRLRIQEIHDTIGEDAEILDKTEQLNEEAMYAIYEGDQQKIDKYEEEEDLLSITEAEEIIRDLQLNNPEYFNYIINLRDGVRSCMEAKSEKGKYVFCQAGNFQQLFLVNEDGKIISRDIPQVLSAIKCNERTKAKRLPRDHNKIVMKIKKLFEEEVKMREAEKEQVIRLKQAQRYVIRELRLYFSKIEDEDEKERINLLERTFRSTLYPAVMKELNLIRRMGITGEILIKRLSDIYFQYNLKTLVDTQSKGEKEQIVAKIICSESLI
ncbi:MAG: helicase [Candidatus Omnitrophota bacterium]|nr:MAG: helicase [Candidatus Omnitrophota bacterium]